MKSCSSNSLVDEYAILCADYVGVGQWLRLVASDIDSGTLQHVTTFSNFHEVDRYRRGWMYPLMIGMACMSPEIMGMSTQFDVRDDLRSNDIGHLIALRLQTKRNQ